VYTLGQWVKSSCAGALMKQVTRKMLELSRDYVRGLAILAKQPRFAQNLQTREQQIKKLERHLARERREVKRLNREVRHVKRLVGRTPVGEARLLRRLEPISSTFGFDRGQPIDRYYIENFLASQAADIRGRVLEIRRNDYTSKYGGEGVNVSDVLDIAEDNRRATIHADLTRADHIPSDAFDCIILTQTLHFIYDLRSAVQTLYRILKPGGVLLATFPGISKTSCRECTQHGEYYRWMFTQLSAQQLFEETFPAVNLRIEAHGNVLAAVSFLHGLAVEELHQEELDHYDPDYEVLITLRAVKPEVTPC
jgi:SAM-dependent methyltransferase